MGFLYLKFYFFFCKNSSKAFTKKFNFKKHVPKDMKCFFKPIPQGGFKEKNWTSF